MGKIYNWVRTNKKAIATGTAGIAGAVGMHAGFDLIPINGQTVYQMSDTARFLPEIMAALALGRANEIRYRNEVGRNLTPRERIHAYLDAGVVMSLAWESWEVVGATQPVYPHLKEVYEPAKQTFVGQGSALDAAATTAISGGLVAAKEYLSSFARRFRKGE